MLPMLIACPADRLGVELQAGGVGTISSEDLQRDTHALSRPDAYPGEVFKRRLEQMNLPASDVGTDRVCARREGEGRARVLVAPWPEAGATLVEDAARAAVLVSVAKGWDGQPLSGRPTWLCLAKPGATLPDGDPLALGVAVEADHLEAIDYRKLRDDTQAFFRTLAP
ncbi:MAG: hypothetical protein Q8P18_19445 [Pseudomonadota bacterium]|nr:hypothetical protein [Pseudomonadota bacterium]